MPGSKNPRLDTSWWWSVPSDESVVSKVGGCEFIVMEDLIGQFSHSFIKNEGAKLEGRDGMSASGNFKICLNQLNFYLPHLLPNK